MICAKSYKNSIHRHIVTERSEIMNIVSNTPSSSISTSTSSSSSIPISTSQPSKPSRKPKYSKFTQQDLTACKPILTPVTIITAFMLIGVIFIPIGVGALLASRSVVEIVYRYDTDCIPYEYRSNKLAYIQNDLISKNCNRVVKVPKHMKAPIYVYYQLDNFYQNHRRYVKSRSNKQLLYGLKDNSSRTLVSCEAESKANNEPIVPCGLIAWSLFNDTYKFTIENVELTVNKKNIAWESDREHKFGKDVYPYNFQNGALIGGAKLDPSIPLSEQQDLIVWMRTAALPTFRKVYGIIEVDLEANGFITIEFRNNYNVYSFGGKKSLVLSTASWLGGKNDFLGEAYIVIGLLSMLLSVIFFVMHIRLPRRIGDTIMEQKR